MASPTIIGWFALQVRPRSEKHVTNMLRCKQLEPFLPSYIARRRWADRYKNVELPLFPGYVFCRFSSEIRTPVVTTPGVISIVKMGGDIAPIDDGEIEALQALTMSHLHCEPWEYLQVGRDVRIEEGPLKSVTGKLVEVKRAPRLVLSVTLLRRSVLVEIDQKWIAPYPSSFNLTEPAPTPNLGRRAVV